MDATPRKLRILIVDDSVLCAEMLQRVVALFGHHSRTAHDGVAGVDAAADYQPDVVLMDIGLPGLDGYEAARRIRDGSQGTAVCLIALTASGQEIDGPRFQEAGFDHHLAKPVDIEALARMIGHPDA